MNRLSVCKQSGGWHAQADGASMDPSPGVEHGRAALGHTTRRTINPKWKGENR